MAKRKSNAPLLFVAPSEAEASLKFFERQAAPSAEATAEEPLNGDIYVGRVALGTTPMFNAAAGAGLVDPTRFDRVGCAIMPLIYRRTLAGNPYDLEVATNIVDELTNNVQAENFGVWRRIRVHNLGVFKCNEGNGVTGHHVRMAISGLGMRFSSERTAAHYALSESGVQTGPRYRMPEHYIKLASLPTHGEAREMAAVMHPHLPRTVDMLEPRLLSVPSRTGDL